MSGQTFDGEDRVSGVGTAKGSAGNLWRVDGLRGSKTTGAGATTVDYLYAGGVPVCEMTGSTVTAVKVWGPTGLLARQTTNPTTGTSASRGCYWRNANSEKLCRRGAVLVNTDMG